MKPYYEHAGIVIYHGDWRLIPECNNRGPFDLLLTDPPYGVGRSAGTGKYGREKWSSGDKRWDSKPPSTSELDWLRSLGRSCVIWGGNYFTLPPSRKFLVWDKGAGFKNRDFAECELAWCSWDGNAQVFTRDPLANGDYDGKCHPTQKPIALMKWCIALTPKGVQTVFDPYMGSGTTLVAAKAAGLSAMGVEREEAYCESAAERLRQEVLF